MAALEEIIKRVREHPDIKRKNETGAFMGPMLAHFPGLDVKVGPGDDAGAMAFTDGYLLMACSAVPEKMVTNDPRAAGRAAVSLCANNIAAMGGGPVGMTDIIACSDRAITTELITGMSQGCRAYGISLLGGKYNSNSDQYSLTVTMAGRANKLLKGNSMRPGDDILACIDLAGDRTASSVYNWDSVSNRSPGDVWKQLGILPYLAEEKLARACKDIPFSGILGAVSLMAESSSVGCVIDLNAIPRPKQIDIPVWIETFPHFGFVFSAHPKDSDKIISAFDQYRVACGVIGEATIGGVVELELGTDSATLFDYRTESILGWGK